MRRLQATSVSRRAGPRDTGFASHFPPLNLARSRILGTRLAFLCDLILPLIEPTRGLFVYADADSPSAQHRIISPYAPHQLYHDINTRTNLISASLL
jgi:hypothetical protein